MEAFLQLTLSPRWPLFASSWQNNQCRTDSQLSGCQEVETVGRSVNSRWRWAARWLRVCKRSILSLGPGLLSMALLLLLPWGESLSCAMPVYHGVSFFSHRPIRKRKSLPGIEAPKLRFKINLSYSCFSPGLDASDMCAWKYMCMHGFIRGRKGMRHLVLSVDMLGQNRGWKLQFFSELLELTTSESFSLHCKKKVKTCVSSGYFSKWTY